MVKFTLRDTYCILKLRYANIAEEKEAASELAIEEKEINKHNREFLAGKSTFAEELNEFSDIPKDVFEEDLEGVVFPEG